MWAEVLRSHWGTEATLQPLDGAYDLNYLAKTPDGDAYVLKVMRPGCDPMLIDMQTQAWPMWHKPRPRCPCPCRPFKTI